MSRKGRGYRDSQSNVPGYNTRNTRGSVASSEYSQPSPTDTAGHYRTGSQTDQYGNYRRDTAGTPARGSFDVYSDFNNRAPDDFDERARMNLPVKEEEDTLNNASDTLDSAGGTGGILRSNSNQINPESLTKPKQRKRCCCCSRRICVFIVFFILVALGITLFFVWPRIPELQILGAKADGTPNISVDPPYIKMNFSITIEIKNPENWVPIKFNKIEAQVYDLNTIASYDRPIATGMITKYSLPPRQTSTLDFPIEVDYVGKDVNDATIQDFLSACLPSLTGGKATTLNIRVDVKLHPWAISWIIKPEITKQISDLVD
ncbi:12840_t:CDS:2 [Ambispora gerdemannii]|uniref:12840_t:CDS:1 n=1 Tax=Ambispora gerdemannii TaxID=144530 RepID=A0A9N9AR75_9GLOM|nr:12840_t:CDS:2 [Ambispora gerdemannii]